jgi:hypothetical protein
MRYVIFGAALETSFPKSPRTLQTELGVKSYGFFFKVTCAVKLWLFL